MSDLIDLLAARSGLVCAVGAGGKKTTLYHLATHHGGGVGLTSTVPQAYFPKNLGARVVIADENEIVAAALEASAAQRLVAFAHPPVKKGRYGGLEPDLIAELHRHSAFDVLLVKADGARMRWIKAPEENEPVLPRGTTTVIPVVSARALGEPLSEQIAHRPNRLQAITGARAGEPITPVHLARLLTSAQGALKDTATARVVPVINMVDDAERRRAATETARAALDMTDRFDQVVLTCHRGGDPLVDVVG